MKNKKWMMTAAVAGTLSSIHGKAAQPEKPNILLIIADDMGFSDPGCYGGEIKTPNLDRLANEGARFTQFYNCAVCWATRTSIMTGYYPRQAGCDPYNGNRYAKWTKPLPQMLNARGYRTYHSGKWHVSAAGCNSAYAAGFNHAYDDAQGWLDYTPANHALDGKTLPRPKPEDGYFMDNAIAGHMVNFLNEHFEKYSEQPFFAYMAFQGTHYPLKAPKEFVDPYTGIYDEGWDVIRQRRYDKMMSLGFPPGWKLSTPEPDVHSPFSPQTEEARRIQNETLGFEDVYEYVPWNTLSDRRKKEQAAKMEIQAGMVSCIDYNIGRVVDMLSKHGVLDNTLIVFLSDNGAASCQLLQDAQMKPPLLYTIDKKARWGSENTCLALGPAWANVCNTPFRQYKVWSHEGGIATPLIARWPKGITLKPGSFVSAPGLVIDFVPTLLELAGGQIDRASPEAPPFPGKSLLPAFCRKDIPRDYLYWNRGGNKALIHGQWKIATSATNVNQWELYNLQSDRTEMHDLAEAMPEKLRDLASVWDGADNKYEEQCGYPGKKRTE
jgi:arylsulfatase